MDSQDFAGQKMRGLPEQLDVEFAVANCLHRWQEQWIVRIHEKWNSGNTKVIDVGIAKAMTMQGKVMVWRCIDRLELWLGQVAKTHIGWELLSRDMIWC